MEAVNLIISPKLGVDVLTAMKKKGIRCRSCSWGIGRLVFLGWPWWYPKGGGNKKSAAYRCSRWESQGIHGLAPLLGDVKTHRNHLSCVKNAGSVVSWPIDAYSLWIYLDPSAKGNTTTHGKSQPTPVRCELSSGLGSCGNQLLKIWVLRLVRIWVWRLTCGSNTALH